MTAAETIAALEKKLLEAYKVKAETEDAIRALLNGLQGVELGKAAAREEQAMVESLSKPIPTPAAAGYDANGSPVA